MGSGHSVAFNASGTLWPSISYVAIAQRGCAVQGIQMGSGLLLSFCFHEYSCTVKYDM